MFTEEYCFGLAVLEPDDSMFPVADVVSEADVEDRISEIVAVEEEPEGIYHAVAFIHDDKWYRRIASSAYDSLASEATLSMS